MFMLIIILCIIILFNQLLVILMRFIEITVLTSYWRNKDHIQTANENI